MRAHHPDVLDAGTSGGAGPVHHRAVRLARTTPEPSSDPVLSPSRVWTMETTLIAHRQAHGWPPVHAASLRHETVQFKVAVFLRTRWTRAAVLATPLEAGFRGGQPTASPRTRCRRTNSPPSSRKMEN
ncbi:uncharacterized protein BO87DRAFT_459330 [Aspergillus neoniger CBS 115656]|uniref:Uncharacterized protein n=1 Tax=Aspergillus neoniger (strain CBS 115656) TaxID=1448310 RepID=A0A318YHP6_ASPNB|nr:hypothetical protein BO87DRAFT_459330 [Aspergillus neoniger CBS 115656]PYH34031.1 hypothetical protein BO87DRAFT_459330 [Aspergillus neoniger CBS 115656]